MAAPAAVSSWDIKISYNDPVRPQKSYLDNGLTVVGGLRVDDDFQLHAFRLHNTLQGW